MLTNTDVMFKKKKISWQVVLVATQLQEMWARMPARAYLHMQQ